MEGELRNCCIKLDLDKYTKLRRQFHSIPEIGFKEYKTQDLIWATLVNLPSFRELAKVTRVGETGMYIDIHGTKSTYKAAASRLIAIRADIDGLPFEDMSDLPYKSKHRGMIHGCGHDGHTTMLIATLDYFLSKIHKVPQNFGVRFIFQPNEEGLLGSRNMIAAGCLNQVEEIYGLHNANIADLGTIGVVDGTILAKSDIFNISIHGKGGHSSVPYKCVSPITVGSQLLNGINQISSQDMSPEEQHAIGIGIFSAGDTHNVIPETAKIGGTVRSLKNETGEKIIKRIKTIAKGLELVYDCKIDLEAESQGNCTYNHKKPTQLVREIAKENFAVSERNLPAMASEDFSFYLDNTPGCFFILGTRDEQHVDFVHTDKYDFNDKSMPYGVEMFTRIIENRAEVNLL